MDKIKTANRILWVDTAKALGMFFIVLGHFFPPYISPWIYTFNVPLFFFISGFLAKKEEKWSVFWHKNVNGLVIPFLLLSVLINIPWLISNVTDVHNLILWFLGVLFGFHSIDGINGCLNMWFVYCLLVVKVLFQFTSSNTRISILFVMTCLCGMIIYHQYELQLRWAVSNVLYAYPYFVAGYWFKQKSLISLVAKNITACCWNIPIILATLFSGVIACYNGIAYTYEGGVGKSLIIMMLCSVINILSMIRLSYAIQHFREHDVCVISKGSILILAFHLVLVYPIGRLVGHFLKEYPVIESFTFAIFSLCICIAFIPFINFVHKHLPILMGRR